MFFVLFLMGLTACSIYKEKFHINGETIECGNFDKECIADAKKQKAEEDAKREKWEKSRVRCRDYLNENDGTWYAAAYSNRLYDRCKYNGRSNCWSWAHDASECVKLKCQFEPVYYNETYNNWKFYAFITKKQFDNCF